ncbi:hypothetical protein CYLTODRAFT_420375 [Cylindrobasidium torrendii FP15055 ss-10]|uniref:RING-type domain-containing protein n=1 Tax=Cylindrobasidium torrendii FP15055 ss-10 TaxID=1314674 RepID=A0A0D7BIB3_9AGAR|nr:hypothetical protein CYLTODRAFT_420375 [Cylindrobasidium torrendii FP15055 ss-10]
MRTSVSSHVEPIRGKPQYYWPRLDGNYRPALNLGALRQLISSHGDAPIEGKGKKRAASPSEPRPKKRMKMLNGQAAQPGLMAYPVIQDEFIIDEVDAVGALPILQHTFNIELTTATDQQGHPETHWSNDASWKTEEAEFLAALDGLKDTEIELGRFALGRLGHARGELVVFDPPSGAYICLIPPSTWKTDIGRALVDTITLAKADRTTLTTDLRLTRHATTEDDDPHLPFTLLVDITILFAPTFYDSFAPVDPKDKSVSVARQRELAQTRESLIRQLFIPKLSQAAITIPFLYSVLQPAPLLPSQAAADAIQPPSLVPQLLPFQRRTVAWLLSREGKEVTQAGKLVDRVDPTEFSFWELNETTDKFYFNRLTGGVSRSLEPEPLVHGGILAEEPGLGKTLEIIALVLLNPALPSRNPDTMSYRDEDAGVTVKGVKGTLIVTPISLAGQWMDELKRHAPTLKVLLYEGWGKVPVPINSLQVEEERERRIQANKRAKGKKDKEQLSLDIVDWAHYVNEFDVVVTTYKELRDDLNVARPIVRRPRRTGATYSNLEHPRSPLILCEWHRVVMDEVQMVGGGKVEEMVSLIPRASSFAVSGTPARSQVSDLIHVLRFLRLDHLIGNTRHWQNLVQPQNAELFANFIRTCTVRAVKATLTEELTIPQQTRFLVPIQIGPVERHIYDQALDNALTELGVDNRGVALEEDWEIDAGVLRSAVRRLRGLCTHPQVGQLQHERVGTKTKKLKTIEEVLQDVQEQNWREVMETWNAQINSKTRLAQLKQQNMDNNRRHQEALDSLLATEKDCTELIAAVEEAIEAHKKVCDEYKANKQSRRDAQGEDVDDDSDDDEDRDEDGKKSGLPKSYTTKQGALSNRLRDCRIALHRVKFLQGDIYNVLGEQYHKQEEDSYAACERLRRELLKATADDARKGMVLLKEDLKDIFENELRIPVPFLGEGGKLAQDLVDEFHEVVDDVFNPQTDLLQEWRTHLHQLLSRKLVADDGEADGQEYQRSLDDQGEAEAYLHAYTALLGDRRLALVNERTLLAAHDAKEKRKRKTKAALQAMEDEQEINGGINNDMELQPEYEVLKKELNERRTNILLALKERSMQTILVDLNAQLLKARDIRETAEKKDAAYDTIREIVQNVRTLMSDQGRTLDKLRLDLVLFRKVFNQRIQYFRQLQEISDTVAQVTWEDMTYAQAVQETEAELEELQATLKKSRATQRYVANLQDRDAASTSDECILCGDEFEHGFLTQCAHTFCEDCLKAWIVVKHGKFCPVCRVEIDPANLQKFTVSAEVKKPKVARKSGEPDPEIPVSRRKIEYNTISPDTFDAIQDYHAIGDYGEKVQTLVKHLLYLQDRERGCKSIVFSAWSDSLQILQTALSQNGIRCLKIDQKAKGLSAADRFKDDKDIHVLLLHGERENAGLNITCASRVFLLESVVQHAFEVQAIARIDRLGQRKETEVYCYYAEGTIERNILDLAARRGLSLYTKENSVGTLHVGELEEKDESKEVDLSKDKKRGGKTKALKGDFISKVDDMLAILFPHMYEETEYLVGEDAMVNEDEGPVAGPSGS